MTRRQILQYAAAVAAAWTLPTFRAQGLEQSSGELPPHPRLLLDKDGIRELKARIAANTWAAETWKSLKTNLDAKVDKLITVADLPPRGGNWSHNYVCPTHGTRLRQGKQIGPWKWEHICPTGPHTLTGNPSKGTTDFDGNGIMGVHLSNADLLKDAGLVFQMTGDQRYAAFAKSLLMSYAEQYLKYDIHDKEGKRTTAEKGGRIACQPLTEASWFINALQGADMIWDTLSPAERKKAETDLFRPAVEQTFLTSKLGIHNIQCRINSAVGLTGFLINNPAYISNAIDSPTRGFHRQLAEGVLDDGLWHEGSSGYHYFTIEGLWPLAEAARNCDIDLYTPKFKSMFDGPFSLARPDNVLPNFNDSGDSPLASQAPIYELGLARFKDDQYASVINAGAARAADKAAVDDAENPADSGPRRNRMAMLFGVAPLPTANFPERKSHNDLVSGYAIIQRGNDTNATWLCVKYGQHGGGHGHFDKNHFILYTRGAVLAPDVGTHAYGSPLHAEWDKLSLAHNTLTVDEQSQIAAEGRSIAFGSEQGVDYSISDAGDIYVSGDKKPYVRFIRSAAMVDANLIVFVDQIVADRKRTMDLVYHQQGEWEELPKGEAWKSPLATAYKHFKEPTTRLSREGIALATRLKDKTLSGITLAGGAETEIVTGRGVLKSTADLIPMLVMRREAQQTTYVWALSLDGTKVQLETLPVKADGQTLATEVAVGVRVSRKDETRLLLINPEKRQVTVDKQSSSAPFAVLA